MTLDERFDFLLAAAIRKVLLNELRRDLGDPATVGAARSAWKRLQEVDGRAETDRLRLELKYGDEVEW